MVNHPNRKKSNGERATLLSRVSQLESDCRMKDEALREARAVIYRFFKKVTRQPSIKFEEFGITKIIDAALSPAPQPDAVQADLPWGFLALLKERGEFWVRLMPDGRLRASDNYIERFFYLPASPPPADDAAVKALVETLDKYFAEYDTPAKDYVYRHTLRKHLRKQFEEMKATLAGGGQS